MQIEEAEPVKAETPSKAQVMLLNGPDFVEAPHSQIGEDEFFDAVETSLDKLQEELYYRDKLKLMGETSLVPNAPNSEAVNHPLWCTIDETSKYLFQYSKADLKIYRNVPFILCNRSHFYQPLRITFMSMKYF